MLALMAEVVAVAHHHIEARVALAVTLGNLTHTSSDVVGGLDDVAHLLVRWLGVD